MAGPTAACLGIIGRTSARLQWLWLCLERSRGSGLYRLPEPRVSTMESYPYTSCLHYVTLSCTSRIRPSILEYVGSGMLYWASRIRQLVPGLDFFHQGSTATGPPGGLGASATSMGHPGLPDSRHYCWIPGNHTHNNGGGGGSCCCCGGGCGRGCCCIIGRGCGGSL